MTTKPEAGTAPATTEDTLVSRAEDQAVASVTEPELPADYAENYKAARAAERGGFRYRVAAGKLRTQIERLLWHMQNVGPISQREALIEYHIASLTRRIVDIEELGYKVVKTTKVKPVSGNPYTRYGLEGGPQD